jgi:uncharacterized protein
VSPIDRVDVTDLLGHPGTSRELHLSEPVAGLSTPLAEVPANVPVSVDTLLESVVEGILVSGNVVARATLRCARCLTEFGAEIGVDVQELFARGGAEEEDDAYPIGEGTLDLVPMVRDAIVLNLPFSPLCREDCRGLCPRCGGDRNFGECTCGPEIDERWAPLQRLLESGP